MEKNQNLKISCFQMFSPGLKKSNFQLALETSSSQTVLALGKFQFTLIYNDLAGMFILAWQKKLLLLQISSPEKAQ